MHQSLHPAEHQSARPQHPQPQLQPLQAGIPRLKRQRPPGPLERQIELAEISDLDMTTMVVTVDDLEKAGLAERRPSSADRRARIIAVTPAGERAVAEGTAVADRVHRDVLDALPAEQREVLTGALTRLVGGHLATPVESARPVRRARQSRS